MKQKLIAVMVAACLCCQVNAEDMQPLTNEAVANVAAVPAKLQEMDYISTARPAADARFYVYLCSASWCPPCRAIMPRIVQQYPEIRKAGGEIILLSFDRTPEAGKAYLKKYNAAFPSVMMSTAADKEHGLPGFTPPRGIPNVIIVTPEGRVLHSGHGATLLNWRNILDK